MGVHSMTQTKAKVEEIISSLLAPVYCPECSVMVCLSHRHQSDHSCSKLVTPVHSMTQTKSLPQTERVYFLVTPPKETGKAAAGVWVSNKWVMGRVVDSLAASLGAKNENNVVGKDKIKLFRAADGKSVCEDMSEVLETAVAKEELFNGDSVVLEYVKDNSDVIVIES